jgi:hypothetical protein
MIFSLNSAFCFILRHPYPTTSDDGTKGKVYVWMGGKSDKYYHSVAKEIAEELINADDKFPVEEVNEGSVNMWL